MNLQIAFIVSLMGCIVTVPLFFRYGYYLNISPALKTALFLLFIFIGCLPVLASHNSAALFGKYFKIAEYTCYFVYITAVILLSLTVFRDIIWTFIHLLFKSVPSPLNKETLDYVNLATIAVSIICAVWAVYEGTKVPAIKEVDIISPKITQEKTVAVLSDLHISRTISPDKIKGIVAETNKQNPDVILLLGDIIDDDTTKVADITALLNGLKANDGIYFVTGNHEFYIGYNKTVNELKSHGFTFLENDGVSVAPNLYIGGIPDFSSAIRNRIPVDVNKSFANASDTQYRLLMSHSPAKFDEQTTFDLQVSGHTHGGQVFPFHILSWLYNNKYLAGLYDTGDKHKVYVSRGSGQWGPQMRFLAPSEITILKLIPAKE